MRLISWTLVVGCIGVVLFLRHAANSHPHIMGDVQPEKMPDCVPLYIPRGAPLGRVATPKRSVEKGAPTIAVLAPDLTGLTWQEQPTLYWYLSAVTAYPIELVISRRRFSSPLLKTRLPSPQKPGLQRVRLADYGKRLEPAIKYQWSIALILDAKRPSGNLVARGFIELESIETLEKDAASAHEANKQRLMQRVELLKRLKLEVAQSSREIYPHLYARSGLWYDALSAVSDLITSGSQNRKFQHQRAFLLEQVGISQEVISFNTVQGR